MALAVWGLGLALADSLAAALWQKIGALAAIVVVGAALYGALALAAGAMRLSDLSALRRQ
jgi:hypothetical protein